MTTNGGRGGNLTQASTTLQRLKLDDTRSSKVRLQVFRYYIQTFQFLSANSLKRLEVSCSLIFVRGTISCTLMVAGLASTVSSSSPSPSLLSPLVRPRVGAGALVPFS